MLGPSQLLSGLVNPSAGPGSRCPEDQAERPQGAAVCELAARPIEEGRPRQSHPKVPLNDRPVSRGFYAETCALLLALRLPDLLRRRLDPVLEAASLAEQSRYIGFSVALTAADGGAEREQGTYSLLTG